VNPELLVLVPLLLLPVVGLLAFAGCGTLVDTSLPEQPPPPPPPPPRPAYTEVIRTARGLVAYWPFADPAGSDGLRDVGPSRLDGRYVPGPPDVERGKPDGATGRRDPLDRCAGFPGAKAHAVVPFSALLNPGAMLRFSFEVWVRLRTPAARAGESEHLASSRVFGGTEEPSTGWDLFVTYGSDGVPTFTARVFRGEGLTATTAAVEARSATTAPDGSWHHVVLTYDGGGTGAVGIHVRLLGEPELFTQVTTPAPYAPNPSVALTLGAAVFFEPYNELLGDLDEAAFYNHALTADEIREHHGAAQP
jgi:hypothetical protein